VLQYLSVKRKDGQAMLKEKINLGTIYCFLNIIVFIMFYIRIDIQTIDTFYLFFVILCTLKYFYFKKIG